VFFGDKIVQEKCEKFYNLKERRTMDKSRGSFWFKWDLHVHTPASLVQQYGGGKEEVWGRFITDLENLPKEFKVLGINDYYFSHHSAL
jgi:hypothetical protein